MAERGVTRWTPDTCGCVLEYYTDDGSFKGTVSSCPKHSGDHGNSLHLDKVVGHNRQKNAVLNDLIDDLGFSGKDLPFGANYNPAAPADNDPIIVSGLTALQQSGALKSKGQNITIAQLQAKLDQKFGPGKVIIQD